MREHKYRVWCEFEINNVKHTEMAGPENWFLLTQSGHLMSHGPWGNFDPKAEKKYTRTIIEFYTGLEDKNGKEIYEGDIVKMPGAKQAMVVIFQPPSFVMKTKLKNGKLSKSWSDFILHYKENQLVEVIGNIHENPELL